MGKRLSIEKRIQKIDGLKSVIYFIEKEGPPVFTGVGVSDGINIVHIDKTKKNTNSIKWISGNTDESILVTNESINSIMPSRVTELKIIEKTFTKISKSVSERNEILRNSTGLTGTELKQFNPFEVEKDYSVKNNESKFYGNISSSKGGVSKYYAVKGSPFVTRNVWKVTFGQSIVENENRDLRFFVFDNETEYGRSAVSLAYFNNENEANNFVKYGETKLFEFLFRASIGGRRIATFVPDLEDYSNDNPLFKSDDELGVEHEYYGLTLDERLYKFFNLTEKEIHIVENKELY